MVAEITDGITDAVADIGTIGTASMAVVVAFLVWRLVRRAGNKV